MVESTVVSGPGNTPVETTTTYAPPATATPQMGLVPNPPAQPPAPRDNPPAFADDENIPFDEIQLPRINLAQNVGELGQNFDPGTLVFNSQLTLQLPPPRAKGGVPQVPVYVVILGFRAIRFTEKIIGGGMGRLAQTESDVYNMGGTVNYDEAKATGKPLFRKLATALLLVRMPEGCEDPSMFPFVVERKEGEKDITEQYAIATWNFSGASFTSAVRAMKTWRKLGSFRDADAPKTDKGAYRNRFIKVTSMLKTFQENKAAYVPVVQLDLHTPPEVRDIAKEFLSN